jgi:cell division protein FtsX
MNKILTLTIAVIFFLLTIFTVYMVYSSTNKSYTQESTALTGEIAATEAKIEKIKADKDDNNYLPSDVVKYFLTELKRNSVEAAKLYVSKEAQDKNFQEWMGEDPTLIVIKEVTYEVNDGSAKVKAEFEIKELTDSGTFILNKEDSKWKIVDIRED